MLCATSGLAPQQSRLDALCFHKYVFRQIRASQPRVSWLGRVAVARDENARFGRIDREFAPHLHGLSVVAAASPRPGPTEYPLCGRGVAATYHHEISTSPTLLSKAFFTNMTTYETMETGKTTEREPLLDETSKSSKRFKTGAAALVLAALALAAIGVHKTMRVGVTALDNNESPSGGNESGRVVDAGALRVRS